MNIQPLQIWRCRDFFSGEAEESDTAVIVLVASDPFQLDDETFVRVQPVSYEITQRTEEDILISDGSILNKPFIIETWNEQPVHVSLLGENIGELEQPLPEVVEQEQYSDEQLVFRKKEMHRTAVFRQSVFSYLPAENSGNGSGNFSAVIHLKIVKGGLLAAIFLGVLFLVWQPFQLAPGAYFEKYATVYPNQLDIQYEHQETLRGEQVSVDGFNSGESELILLAMQNYDEIDFETAVKIFEKVPGIEQKNSKVFYYYALSELFAGNNDAAIQKLEVLQGRPDFVFDSEVLYYLALAYARNGNESRTRLLLESLKEKDPDYLNDKPDILDDLRWF